MIVDDAAVDLLEGYRTSDRDWRLVRGCRGGAGPAGGGTAEEASPAGGAM